MGDGQVNIYVREQVLLNGGKSEEAQLDKYIKGEKFDGFECIYRYKVDGEGKISLTNTVKTFGQYASIYSSNWFSTSIE